MSRLRALQATLFSLFVAGLAGCLVAGPAPGDPPTDDDDTDVPVPHASADVATFAATMQGEESGQDPLQVRTRLSGAFQLVYWEAGSGAPLCRQRFEFDAAAHFGPQMIGACGACAGLLAVQGVRLAPGPEPEDACLALPAGQDLSFLLTTDDAEGPGDFRSLALVSFDTLAALDFVLGDAGIGAEELVESYAEAGLEATYIAMVRPGGWLGTVAALGEIASPFGELGWLPMFVVYRDGTRQGNARHLEGDTYMTSLWQVAVGRSPEDESGPHTLDSAGEHPN